MTDVCIHSFLTGLHCNSSATGLQGKHARIFVNKNLKISFRSKNKPLRSTFLRRDEGLLD